MSGKKVKSLEVENFKRIELVLLQPEGHSVIIKGANGAGKSSLTDALVVALCGKRFCPDRPIRDGENHAHVKAEIGNIVIRRDWDRKSGDIKEKTTLRYDDGRPISSPQTFLDNLFGNTKFAAFDPGQFIRDEKSQRSVLLKMIGVDDLLEEIKKDYDIIFSKRHDVNKKIRNQKGVIIEINIPGEEVPKKLFSAGDLSREISKATKTNQENARKRSKYRNAKDDYDRVGNEINKLKKSIVELRELQAGHANVIESLEDDIENLRDIDTSDIIVKLEGIEEQNKAISKANKQREIRKLAEDKLAEMQIESDEYTRELETLLYKKTDALKNAKFPVPGLSVDDNNVLFNGMPISQESDSKRLQIAIQIAIAKIPKEGIRIIRMKDASMLDKKSMIEVDQIAREKDVQIFLERVGNSDKTGHLISEGILVRDCQ
jgi:DNA repair exonuclease SbcCD ATPase subunit